MNHPDEPECTCGSTVFERVKITRTNGALSITEFVACEHCRIMYWRPLPVEKARPGFDLAKASDELVRATDAMFQKSAAHKRRK